MGQLTMSPVSAGFTAYLDSYMEPRLSTAGQPHVRLASVPRPSAIAPQRQGSSRRSSHYACKAVLSLAARLCLLALHDGFSLQLLYQTLLFILICMFSQSMQLNVDLYYLWYNSEPCNSLSAFVITFLHLFALIRIKNSQFNHCSILVFLACLMVYGLPWFQQRCTLIA